MLRASILPTELQHLTNKLDFSKQSLRIKNNPVRDIDRGISKCVTMLPPAWQFPQNTYVQILATDNMV